MVQEKRRRDGDPPAWEEGRDYEGLGSQGEPKRPKSSSASALLLRTRKERQKNRCNRLEEAIHVMAAKNSARHAAPKPGLARRSQLSAGSRRHRDVCYRVPGGSKRGSQGPALLQCLWGGLTTRTSGAALGRRLCATDDPLPSGDVRYCCNGTACTVP